MNVVEEISEFFKQNRLSELPGEDFSDESATEDEDALSDLHGGGDELCLDELVEVVNAGNTRGAVADNQVGQAISEMADNFCCGFRQRYIPQHDVNVAPHRRHRR